MRLEADGSLVVDVDGSAGTVRPVLADRQELLAILGDLLHPRSTAQRWVLGEVRLGPAVLAPAVDVSVTADGEHVRVRGRPVDGHTRSWLDVDVHVPESPGPLRLRSTWRVAVDVPGPQFMATTVRPLVVAGARRTATTVGRRLRRHFGAPPPPP